VCLSEEALGHNIDTLKSPKMGDPPG
jgi:hypothetical protein